MAETDHIDINTACPACSSQLIWRTAHENGCPDCGLIWRRVNPALLREKPLYELEEKHGFDLAERAGRIRDAKSKLNPEPQTTPKR